MSQTLYLNIENGKTEKKHTIDSCGQFHQHFKIYWFPFAQKLQTQTVSKEKLAKTNSYKKASEVFSSFHSKFIFSLCINPNSKNWKTKKKVWFWSRELSLALNEIWIFIKAMNWKDWNWMMAHVWACFEILEKNLIMVSRIISIRDRFK